MIRFYFPEGRHSIAKAMHKALIGSPAYINSEIAICNGEKDDDFNIIVGNDNGNDLEVMMDHIKIEE